MNQEHFSLAQFVVWIFSGGWILVSTTVAYMRGTALKKQNGINAKLEEIAYRFETRLNSIEKNMRTNTDCEKHSSEIKEWIKMGILEHLDRCRQRRSGDYEDHKSVK